LPEQLFISVIITAFNRRDFLFRALNSALNQTLDKSKYEIIVAKNFKDGNIDSLIEKSGIISLQHGNETVGSYIATGIERSRGEILVFLDDDDEFVKEKLQVVEEIFASDRGIGYYHNGIIPINSSGNEISIDFRKRTMNFIQKTGRFYIQKPLTGSNANKLLRAAAYGYLSSIAIRKSVIVPFLPYLKSSIESSQDFFTFYSALLSPACRILVVDPLRLTRYRLHEANVSLFVDSARKDSSNQNDIRILRFLEREEKSMESVLKMSTEIDDARDEKQLKIVRKMIGYEIYSRKVDLNMIDPASNRRRVLSDAIKFLKYSFRSRFLTSQMTILVRCVLWVLFPKTTKQAFMRRYAKLSF
jgi:glycosyltransferase involved in cell wall biosynthesis